MEIGERIKKVRKMADQSQLVFAEKLGVDRSHISNIEMGNREPSQQLIKLICVTFGINEDWLKNGEGLMTLVSTKLIRIVKDSGLPLPNFAEKIGISKNTLINYRDGTTTIPVNILEKINEEFSVRWQWWSEEDGDPYEMVTRHPGTRDVLLAAYEGKNRGKIKKMLYEGEYTLFERLILINTAYIVLDTSIKEDKRLLDYISRKLLYFSRQPEYKSMKILSKISDPLMPEDISRLKSLAFFAFSEGIEELFDCFWELIAYLEYWDFDFKTYTLKLKIYSHDFRLVPLLISESR